MGVYFKNMQMPRDCPMCPAAHYNKLDEFTGCDAVPGKRYAAMQDKEYAESSTRPDWCPAVEVKGHDRLIDADVLLEAAYKAWGTEYDTWVCSLFMDIVSNAPTVIEAEDG